MREAVGWSAFYVAIPVAFGVWIWQQLRRRPRPGVLHRLPRREVAVGRQPLRVPAAAHGVRRAARAAAARAAHRCRRRARAARRLHRARCPAHRVVLVGVPAVRRRPARDGRQGAARRGVARRHTRRHRLDPRPCGCCVASCRSPSRMPAPASPCAQAGRRALTPLALVIVAILGTDVVFAIDSVPAVYGITGDPYLVFATNAFALLGLRALYFVVEGALGSLRHLGHGLAAILAFIGVKLGAALGARHLAVRARGADPRLARRHRRDPRPRDDDEHPGQPSRRARRCTSGRGPGPVGSGASRGGARAGSGSRALTWALTWARLRAWPRGRALCWPNPSLATVGAPGATCPENGRNRGPDSDFPLRACPDAAGHR